MEQELVRTFSKRAAEHPGERASIVMPPVAWPVSRKYPVTDLFHLRLAGAVPDELSADLADLFRPESLLFLEELEARFGERRRALLTERAARRARLREGRERLGLLESTAPIRRADWSVAAAPEDLNNRRVEITGPAERKMTINALNSGANVFMADFEDALSPTWANLVAGQACLRDAVRRKLRFVSPEGREYRLNDRLATLAVRPRGWHLVEKNLRFDGQPVSASLVDFGLFFFHNAEELIRRGSGPYFYLPKLESYLEARLWNDVFVFAEEHLGIPRGAIRATVLIETLPAAFEMDEILFELREHAAGLNAGRWDYLFSMIKTLPTEILYPDRAQLTMETPFMRAYARNLVAICHRRGAHAIGGMAAFLPSRQDSELNERALAKVREDKTREAGDGFDGTWVAHPDLVPVARAIFDDVLGAHSHQKDRGLNAPIDVAQYFPRPVGRVSEAGVNANISVALQYLSSWLRGQGAVAIDHLMEDAATAEIARVELWQWVKREVPLIDGDPNCIVRLTRDEFRRRLESARACFAGQAERGRLSDACRLLERLVLADECPDFLTTEAYELLETQS